MGISVNRAGALAMGVIFAITMPAYADDGVDCATGQAIVAAAGSASTKEKTAAQKMADAIKQAQADAKACIEKVQDILGQTTIKTPSSTKGWLEKVLAAASQQACQVAIRTAEQAVKPINDVNNEIDKVVGTVNGVTKGIGVVTGGSTPPILTTTGSGVTQKESTTIFGRVACAFGGTSCSQ